MDSFETGFRSAAIHELSKSSSSRVLSEEQLCIGSLYVTACRLKGIDSCVAAQYPARIDDMEFWGSGVSNIGLTILDDDLQPQSSGWVMFQANESPVVGRLPLYWGHFTLLRLINEEC